MESSDHDDDDDFINDKPKYPQKNIFTASFSIDKAEIVDHTMKPRETDSAEGACSICGKNISHLNETRRLQHVNRYLKFIVNCLLLILILLGVWTAANNEKTSI